MSEKNEKTEQKKFDLTKLSAEDLQKMIDSVERLIAGGGLTPSQASELKFVFNNMKNLLSDVAEIKRDQANLAKAFVNLTALIQSKPAAARAAPPKNTSTPAVVFPGINALPITEELKKKMRMGQPENGKKVIRCDWLGTDNWNAVNTLLRTMGFKWFKDEQNKKNSRWVET